MRISDWSSDVCSSDLTRSTPWTIVSPWNNLSPDPSCNLTNPAAIGALRLLRDRLLPGSSAVEQPAVNRLVDGSNPSRGAPLFKAKNAPYKQVRLRPHPILNICSHNFADGIDTYVSNGSLGWCQVLLTGRSSCRGRV